MSGCSKHELGPNARVGEGCTLIGCVLEGEIGDRTKVWRWAHIMDGAVIGNDCMIGQGVFIADKVKIGNGVRIQNHTDISRHVTIEDDVYVGAGVRFCNSPHPSTRVPDKLESIRVCRGASIGSNACIVGAVTIGPGAVVGAGAVVTHSVPASTTVVGVPARPLGPNGEYPLYEEFL